MTRTRPSHLLLLAAVTLLASWGVLAFLESRGVHLPAVSWSAAVAVVVLSVVVLVGGRTLRSYQQGDRPTLSGPVAARLTMLGKAAAHTGALLVGWYGAQLVLALTLWTVEPQRSRALSAGITAAVSVLLVVVGLVTERHGQLPPPTDDAATDAEGTTHE